jgi:hypothetical protein
MYSTIRRLPEFISTKYFRVSFKWFWHHSKYTGINANSASASDPMTRPWPTRHSPAALNRIPWNFPLLLGLSAGLNCYNNYKHLLLCAANLTVYYHYWSKTKVCVVCVCVCVCARARAWHFIASNMPVELHKTTPASVFTLIKCHGEKKFNYKTIFVFQVIQ